MYDNGSFPTDLGYKILGASIEDIEDREALIWRRSWTNLALKASYLTEVEKMSLCETLLRLDMAIEEFD